MIVALLFVTLPFVVRSVQPVLIELDQEVEEAAASLGASNVDDVPADHPAGAAPGDPLGRGARVRALRSGEFGSLVLIAGKVQIASIVIFADIESDAPQAGGVAVGGADARVADRAVRASAGSGAALLISRRHKLSLRTVALLYLRCSCCCRSASCSVRTFEHGFGDGLGLDDHAGGGQRVLADASLIAAIAVPLNTIFGVGCALVLVRAARPRGRASSTR